MHKTHLQQQFGVRSLAQLRGTAGEGSDVDVLVSFSGPTSFKQYFGA
jgi:predicted nucleotidyltransferase